MGLTMAIEIEYKSEIIVKIGGKIALNKKRMVTNNRIGKKIDRFHNEDDR